MQSLTIKQHQKSLASQVDALCALRVGMIEVAIERTNNYLKILELPSEQIARQFLKLQRNVVLAQPNVMNGAVEGKDFLPAKRHAFSGVPMPLSQIIASIELEKKQCLDYIAISLLPVPMGIDAVSKASESIALKQGGITVGGCIEYIKKVVVKFLSFLYYQTALKPIHPFISKKGEVLVKDIKAKKGAGIGSFSDLMDNILLFDCLYANRCNLMDGSDQSDCSGVKSNLMSVHTGKKLDKLAAIELTKPLKDTLVQMYSLNVPNHNLDGRQAS